MSELVQHGPHDTNITCRRTSSLETLRSTVVSANLSNLLSIGSLFTCGPAPALESPDKQKEAVQTGRDVRKGG